MRNKREKMKQMAPGKTSGMKRRSFIKLMGGGVFVLFYVGDPFKLLAQRRELPEDFNAFLRIDEEGMVSCFTGKIEMGQGVITSLAQMLADELEVPYDRVEMVMGDTDLCPWDMGTFGSMTTRFFGPPLRAAAAKARKVLTDLASEYLNLSPNQLTIKDGVVMDQSNPEHRVAYGQLTQGRRIEKEVTEAPPLEEYTRFSVVGEPKLRRDSMEKVTGKAKFSGDIRLPGMVYAKVLRPPSHGATLDSVDASAAEQMEGVDVVREGDLVAVLHESPQMAEIALSRIKATYAYDELDVNDKTIFKHLLSVAPEASVSEEGGDLANGEELSDIIIESEYLNSYVAHAPLEPHTALAVQEGNRIRVRASTQTPFPLKDQIARVLNISPDKVHVTPPFVGGGFGGKTSNGQAIEAARLAALTGKPVMVAWTRQEEFFNDTFRPAAVVKIKSGVTKSGSISLWDYSVYFAGSRGSEHNYDIPHYRTRIFNRSWTAPPGTHPFATGAWRAPSNNTNTHARESQIDIMASEAGIDPLEFRLNNLKDEKMIGVLKAAAELFGYTPAKSPSGRGYGIACGIDAGTYVAHIAEVKVNEKTGHVQVVRVACAQNMGRVINPEGATIQIEGCITMGLGYALTEEIRFDGGAIHNKNFDTYELPRFSWTPRIDTVIIDAQHEDPQGGGEPPIISMGAVVANAIYDATGVRLYQLPMTPERVLKAIQKI